MLKKILSTSLVIATLILSGCGDSDGESRLEAQSELDAGNYENVIALLEPTSESTTEEEYQILASAYMTKAGFGLADIVDLMATSNDTGGDGFASFASNIADGRSDTALQDLATAINYYDEVLGTESCDATGLTGTQKDICLFKGLSSLVKTATTLSYLGDLTSFGSTDGSDDELTASTCAMQYAFDGTIGAGCIKVDGSTPTFSSDNSYGSFTMTVNSVDYFYLKTIGATVDSTIITDGYCKTDFTTCTPANNTDCFACPVNQTAGAEELATTTVLLDLLNNDIDAIAAATGGDATDTDSMTSDIDAFKEEVGGADGIVTEQELIDYLNAQN